MIKTEDLTNVGKHLGADAKYGINIIKTLRKNESNCYTDYVLMFDLHHEHHTSHRRALNKLIRAGVFSLNSSTGLYLLNWQYDELPLLISFLEGVIFNQTQVPDLNDELVISFPAGGKLESAAEKAGFLRNKLTLTLPAFEEMAISSEQSLTVMTPFLDEHGVLHIIDLFSRCDADIEKNLILRFLDIDSEHKQYQWAYHKYSQDIADLGVNVYDFSLDRESSSLKETFHAKIISCDDAMAYIGSANMNQYSFFGSMEMGVMIRDNKAKTLGKLLKIILKLSKKEEYLD